MLPNTLPSFALPLSVQACLRGMFVEGVPHAWNIVAASVVEVNELRPDADAVTCEILTQAVNDVLQGKC